MAARKAAPAAKSPCTLRAAVLDPWRNLKHTTVKVPEWGATVVVRALSLADWREYNRMAALLQPAADADPDAPPREPEPWEVHGVRALYAFVVVATLHDENRQPVFATDPAERTADVAELAATYAAVHDVLAAKAFELSGLSLAQGDEPAPDPVDTAGNA